MKCPALPLKIFFVSVITSLLLGSCMVSDHMDRKLKVSLQAGINHGGIVENTDLSVVPGVVPTPESTVDAYTGATRMGGNASVHVNVPLFRNEMETGLDFMHNSQEFTYADQGNHYLGVRNLEVSQFMVPLTYNLALFRKALPGKELQLKIGYTGQLNLVNGKGTGLLPEYSVKTFSQGATLGLSMYIMQLKNGGKLGLFADIYRGSRIYSDFYNQESFTMPGSSFLKFGIRYRTR